MPSTRRVSCPWKPSGPQPAGRKLFPFAITAMGGGQMGVRMLLSKSYLP